MLDQLTFSYVYVFFGAACLLALLEIALPAREHKESVNRRWSSNIGLYLINTLLYRLMAPLSAFALSEHLLEKGGGLLQGLGLPSVFIFVLGFLLLDLLKYGEHRVFHSFKPFWHLHLVHHNDTEVDFTTTERHHPAESAVGILVLYGFIYIMGITPLSLMAYFISGGVVALFSHANIRLPATVDNLFAFCIVTPGFHGVHHSPKTSETDSNFGLVLTFWDRIFGTYNKARATTEEAPKMGLDYYREPRDGHLIRLLYLPFVPLPEKNIPKSVEAIKVRN